MTYNYDKATLDNIYNNMLKLSRKSFFYDQFFLEDSFSTRVKLIFIHTSFLMINLKEKNQVLSQNIFDYIFKQIEINMREIGYGDVTVNKEMKKNVKFFFDILLFCEKLGSLKIEEKESFYFKYFREIEKKNKAYLALLLDYFDKFQKFSLQLSINSIIKGDINFIYK